MKKLLKHKEKILILLIILIASFLRLYKIDEYMTFLGDEGRDVLVVKDIIDSVPFLFGGDFSNASEKLTLLGPTASVGGFFLGPIYYYFMAPFLFMFNYSPVGPAVMVALFGIATVFLVYKVGNEFFGKKAAFIAAFLYAISPLVINYSRSSWNPNLMPFFSLLLIYIFYKALETNNKNFFFLSGIIFGILMQLHYLTVFLIIIAGFYFIFISFYSKNNKKITALLKEKVFKLFIVFTGFIIGWSPFLAFELRHNFQNIKSITSFIFSPKENGMGIPFIQIVYDVFFRLFGRLIVKFPPLDQFIFFDSKLLFLWTVFVLFLAIGSTVFIFYQLINSIKNKDKYFTIYLLIIFWLLFGVLLFGFYKKSIYDYYFSFMFTLPFLLVGNFIQFIYDNKKFKIFGKLISLSVLALLTYLNISGAPFLFSPNKQLEQVKKISDFVLSKTEGKPFNFALITQGNSDHGYRYFFKLNNNEPITIENFIKDPDRKTVTDQLLIVCEKVPCSPLGYHQWEVAGFGRADLIGDWNVSVVKVYKMKHYKENN